MRVSQGKMFLQHLQRSAAREDIMQFENWESDQCGYKAGGFLWVWTRDAHVGLERPAGPKVFWALLKRRDLGVVSGVGDMLCL